MKRFEDEKLHEFVMKKFSLKREDGCYGRFALNGTSSDSLDNDIAGYLQDSLQICVHRYGRRLEWEARSWIGGVLYLAGNKSHTQAIFDVAEKILNDRKEGG